MALTRRDAGPRLLAALERVGIRDGALDLPLIWPVLAAWLREPLADPEPVEDWRRFYISEIPAADPDGSFAGVLPDALRPPGGDLWCVEISRDFARRTGDGSRETIAGGGGVEAWYADSPAWHALAEVDGWIAMGPGTPHVDWAVAGPDLQGLERSPFLAVPLAEPVLAVRAGYATEDDGVELMLTAPRSPRR
jgi:hypothetical protein